MRRLARDRRSNIVQPLDQRIRALAPYSWFEADTYAIDGVSGKVASFVDKVYPGTGIRAITAAHAMTQATDANQVALPVAASELGDRAAATFAAQWYVSNSASSSWQCLHDGTGCEVFHVFSPTDVTAGNRYHLSTRAYGGERGLTAFTAAALTDVIAYVAAGTIWDGYVTGNISTGTGYYQHWYYSETNPSHDWYSTRTGGTPRTGNSTATPEASDAGATLVLGALRSDGNSPAEQKWVSTIIFDRVLTAAERVAALAYIAAKYGVA